MPLDVLLGRDGRPSMRGAYSNTKGNIRLVIRRRLKNGREWFRVYENNNGDKKRKVRIPDMVFAPCVIRWGSRIPIETEGKIVYNTNQAIEKGTNKKESRKIMLQKKVSCPKLVGLDNTVFPVIARPSRHAKGKNFIVLKNVAEFKAHYNANEKNGWYYSEFIDKDREVRVHGAHGKVLEIMEKPRPNHGDKIAWNRAQNGLPFVRIERKTYSAAVCKVALDALKALGLDFGGVDVIIKNEAPYVLEVNTSPTLNSSPHVTSRYAKYFDWLARKNEKRPHWDYTQFKKGESYAWKNFQLDDQVGNDNAE